MPNQNNPQQHQNPQHKAGTMDPKQGQGDKPQTGQPHQPGTNPAGQPKSDDLQRDQGGQRRS